MSKSIVMENVRKIIDNKGLKQKAVATQAGYDYKTFNNMLNNRKLIKAEDIIKLTSVLGVTPNDLFKGTFN